MRAKQITRQTRDIVAERSGGLCEVCRVERATQMHHRRPRGMGGSRLSKTHQPSMLLHVGDGCHAWIERNRQVSLAEGWLLRQSESDRPVRTWMGFVVLDDDGGWTGGFGFDTPSVEHVDGCTWWETDVCDRGCA